MFFVWYLDTTENAEHRLRDEKNISNSISLNNMKVIILKKKLKNEWFIVQPLFSKYILYIK